MKKICANGWLQYCLYTLLLYVVKKDIVKHTHCYPPNFWNTKKISILEDLPIRYGKADELNDSLPRMIRHVEDIISIAHKKKLSDPGKFVKETFDPGCKTINFHNGDGRKHNPDIFFQIDDYIQSKIKNVCKDMPTIYRNMADHLKAFEIFRDEPVTFDCMDLTFYEEFVHFLSYDYIQRRRKQQIVGLKTNTVGKTIKQLRIFLGNRIRKRIIPPIDLHVWTVFNVETDAVYCSRE